jgi:hypothetical protein
MGKNPQLTWEKILKWEKIPESWEKILSWEKIPES